MYCTGEIIRNESLCEGYMRMTIGAPEISRSALPGQFMMLKCDASGAPFFMRPFSINSADAQAGTIDILYKLVGKGTVMMANMRQRERVYVLGPLGNGFPLQLQSRGIALLGRGVGAAPMRFLAEYATKKGLTVYVLLSASCEEQLFDKQIFEGMTGVYLFTTIDPDVVVTDHLAEILSRKTQIDAAYTCGSRRVMRKLNELRKLYSLDCYASLEDHMACGTGACHGCSVYIPDENGENCEVRICKEGPVFPVEKAVMLHV